MRTRRLLEYALVTGILGGTAEAGYLTIRHLVRRELAIAYFPEVMWMAPLAGALAFLGVGIVLALFGRLGRTAVDVSRATLVFSFLVVFGVIQSRGFPLHPAAKVVLSLGIATVIARAAAKRPAAVLRAVARTAPVGAGVLVLLGVIGVATLPGITERRRLARLSDPRAAAPNVLLIILDTVRAANLGLYGHHRDTSPQLDAWAESGVVFERAVVTAPWTLPSHAALFTGQYNFAAGTAFARPLDDRFPTLAEVFGSHGYATAAFVANLSFATRATGLARGFHRYDDLPFTPGMFAHSYWILRGVSRRIATLPGRQYWAKSKRAAQVTDDFLAWLGRRPDRPFFVFLNYFDAHDPYEPPEPFRSMYGPAPEHELSDDEVYTTAQLGPWINAYDGAIRYIDGELGRLFEALAATGLRENTLIVVTSDHGEMFGEHGQIQHTTGVYLPVLHVPLALAFPGVVPAGVRVPAAVSLRDIPATILDIAGIPQAAIGGHSLAALWSGGAPVTSPLLAELDFDHREILSRGHIASLLDGPYHYIAHPGGVEELYDVVADPAEERDLARIPTSAPTLRRLRSIVDSLLQSGR
ncbi:MAG TPA: sulfatase [Longimicrobiales bacterium]|nr:sulfatase [Longimicrobiales bacterium]